MAKLIPLLTCLLFACSISIAPLSSRGQGSSSLVITHANVIDGLAAAPIKDATVLIRDGRIESIVTGKAEIPSGATILDLKGRWLLPGFVDVHAHLSDLTAARRALASGATTVRCLGVNHFVDIGMRELNHAGATDIPDVVAAGYHVRPRPAEEFFLNFPKMKESDGRSEWHGERSPAGARDDRPREPT